MATRAKLRDIGRKRKYEIRSKLGKNMPYLRKINTTLLANNIFLEVDQGTIKLPDSFRSSFLLLMAKEADKRVEK